MQSTTHLDRRRNEPFLLKTNNNGEQFYNVVYLIWHTLYRTKNYFRRRAILTYFVLSQNLNRSLLVKFKQQLGNLRRIIFLIETRIFFNFETF